MGTVLPGSSINHFVLCLVMHVQVRTSTTTLVKALERNSSIHPLFFPNRSSSTEIFFITNGMILVNVFVFKTVHMIRLLALFVNDGNYKPFISVHQFCSVSSNFIFYQRQE